ncbi:NEDD8 activating enzyme [Vanrija albida]|uniref:NEDD8-activating enzyme E1 catalytic subunit n=1 Tax=Vanrija albida TaxID=181172 RepID=A0ABR3QCF0_9TREE
MTKRTLRVALLVNDVPMQTVIDEDGTYYDIFKRWLLKALAKYPDAQVANNTELVFDGFDVVNKLEFPPAEKLVAGGPESYDVIMLTGSRHTAHDENSSFGPTLIKWIREVATNPATQHIRLVGICYGHQIISIALGGSCEVGKAGWEVGVYGISLTEEGKYWWSSDVNSIKGDDKIYAEQMHRDHVPALPPGTQLLGSSEKYPVHSFVKLHPASTPAKPLAQILTIQGHPEFTPSIVNHITDARAEGGIFTPEVAAEGHRRAAGVDGTGGEGEGRLGTAIWKVMLQDLPSQGNAAPLGNGSAEQSTQAYLQNPSRYANIDKLLDRSGPWTDDDSFQGGEKAKNFLRDECKILVIGAGGLGCEILQNLALTGFGNIHVIDMDTIDISNLNRQFLFREADVGKSKALVAADFIMKRVPGIKVTAHHSKIQDHPLSFYKQFNIIIAGLDSISARRWINATLVGMVDEEDQNSLKPLIDGGTEGFKGQARVILPTVTSCYECSIDMLTPPTAFPICTIANTPRLPEHCIEWASVLEWPRVFKDKKLDTDDPDHIEWLFQVASSRAAEFKIEGVTWALTQGVVKNIIPAIASTNAIIAASCCNEAFKIATSCAPFLDNYMMYVGNDSLYTFTFEHEKRPECPVCGGESISAEVGKDWTLEKLVEWISLRQDLQITRPSFSHESGQPLYFQAPPQLHEATKPNLEKLVSDLVQEGETLVVTDPNLPFNLTVEVTFV